MQGKRKSEQPFKPTVMSTKDMNLNFGATADKASKGRISARPFKPTVTSTKDMNLNFSSFKTPVNGHVTTKPATPSSKGKTSVSARKSVGAGQQSARKSVGASAARKSLSSESCFCVAVYMCVLFCVLLGGMYLICTVFHSD